MGENSRMKGRTFLFFALCVVIGAGLVTQTRVTGGERAYVSAKSLADNEISMAGERQEILRLRDLIGEREKELSAYQSGQGASGGILTSVEEGKETWEQAAGCTRVAGPGISILLDDGARNLQAGESANDIIVHDLDLLLLLEELKAAGAEALSINGERYVSSTEISCGGHTVKINGKTFARPFQIRAIGDPKSLYGAVTIPGSYGSLLSECGLIFTPKREEEITIEAYTGDVDFVWGDALKGGGLG